MKALWAFPEQARFGRAVPKNKFYEKAAVTARRRELFVRQVEQIVWQYKLAPETINLPATGDVPEIQVFAIALRVPELDQDVLRCIDGAVRFPILFELGFEGKVQVVACHKRPAGSGAGRWVAGDYFASPWLSADANRKHLPVALSLSTLYEYLLQPLISVKPRSGESLTALVERATRLHAMQRDLARIEVSLNREKQFNRKVEINANLRQLKNQIATLSGKH